jgi:hypothetical protein
MPISDVIDHDRHIVVTTWTGTVTGDELRSHWDKLLSDSDAIAFGRSIVDIRSADLAVSGGEVGALLQELGKRFPGDRRWKTAFLVSEPVKFGSAPQVGALAATVCVIATFYDFNEAVRWLTGK